MFKELVTRLAKDAEAGGVVPRKEFRVRSLHSARPRQNPTSGPQAPKLKDSLATKLRSREAQFRHPELENRVSELRM